MRGEQHDRHSSMRCCLLPASWSKLPAGCAIFDRCAASYAFWLSTRAATSAVAAACRSSCSNRGSSGLGACQGSNVTFSLSLARVLQHKPPTATHTKRESSSKAHLIGQVSNTHLLERREVPEILQDLRVGIGARDHLLHVLLLLLLLTAAAETAATAAAVGAHGGARERPRFLNQHCLKSQNYCLRPYCRLRSAKMSLTKV